MENQADAIDTVIAQFEANIAELERGLSSVSNCLLGAGFIVVIQDIAITYDIETDQATGESRAVNARPCMAPHMACRFSRRDAEQMAETTRNGNGATGKAVHVREAVETDLIEARRLLEMVKQLKAAQ